jgi:hypothetical protein
MRLKAVYAAGGGIVVFVVVILVINNTGTHTITSNNGRQGTNNTAMPLTLSIKSITPTKLIIIWQAYTFLLTQPIQTVELQS